MSANTELAAVPPRETALAVYSTDKGLDPWLEQIRAEVDKFLTVLPELTTDKGRKAFASMAHKVAKSKTALDAVGKELSAQQKEVPKRIDAERKRVWDILELWQKEVRQPLDDWQEAEDRRVDGIRADIEKISDLAMQLDGITAEDLEDRIRRVEAVALADKWAEFQVDAALAKEKALTTLYTALTNRKLYETDQAELAQRRADDEARAQRDRDEQIRREAAERAEREAAETARIAQEQADRREQELKQKADDAERQAKQAKADLEAAEQRAEQERRDSAARTERAAEEARQAEVQRQADVAAEAKRQADAREADIEHRRAINRAAVDAFIAGGMTDACAKQAITLIAGGKIPAIAINY